MSDADHVRLERIATKLAVARALQWDECPDSWRDNADDLLRDPIGFFTTRFGQAPGR